MKTLSRVVFHSAFFGLFFSLNVGAHETGQTLPDPGYRPESMLAAAFVQRVSSAKLAVFPTIIRTPGETSYSESSLQWVAEFMRLNELGVADIADTRFAMGQLQAKGQFDMFQASMKTIGEQVGASGIAADYAVVVEIVIPPIPSGPMQVFGVHCFVLEPDGSNAFSFLLNSHHGAFNDAGLRTSEPGDKGKEWLATESTKLAMMALKAQIDREREVMQPGSTSTRISVVDDFETGLPSGKDGPGNPVGFYTFSDTTSTAEISVTGDHPPRPGESSGNKVLELKMDVTGWAGVIHGFENEAADRWVSKNWRASTGFSFWLFGNNTGAALNVDILDNRKRYSTSDDAERFTYEFRDDFSGWKHISVPFARMVRKEIGNGAEDDGLNLTEVHGWGFGNASSVGEVTYFIDDFALYGGRISLPGEEPMPPASDSRWRNLQTKEGRFDIFAGVRMDPPTGIAKPDAPKLAVYTWHYRHRPDGMPSDSAELEKVLAWARRLDELIVADSSGFQFANRGGANKLGNYFYVADVERLKALSQQAGEKELGVRMDLSVSEDPDWEEWRKSGRPSEAEGKSAGDHSWETAIPVSAMDPVMRFDGFSVRRPNDYRWRLLRNYQRADVATFSFAPLSSTHSFNATILIRGLPKMFYTQEAFKAFVDSKVQDAGPRFEKLSYASSMTQLHGQWAVRYRAVFIDKSPSNSEEPLLMTISGVACQHPLREARVIDAFYSERGTEDELDGRLDPVGEELIESTIPER